MKNNKFYIILSILIIAIFNIIYISYKKYNNVELDEVILKEEDKKEEVVKKETLAVMLQDDNGNYNKSNNRVYPTRSDGYLYNEEKSGCMDVSGKKLDNSMRYDYENNKVLVTINKEALCYVYFDKLYTVTFDANGGSFSGSAPTKEVVYGQEYGTMPEEPTKSGYTFKGWNGKNMFNEEEILMAIPYATYENGYYIFTNYNAYSLHGESGKYFPITNFKESTQYTMTIVGYVSGSSSYFYFSCDGCNYNNGLFNSTIETTKIVTSSFEKTVVYPRFLYVNNASVYIKHIQLEEGTTSTEYEPFYIESDTKVVQRQNHTLKAIWEENPS